MNQVTEQALVQFVEAVTEHIKNMMLALEALKERIEWIEGSITNNREN